MSTMNRKHKDNRLGRWEQKEAKAAKFVGFTTIYLALLPWLTFVQIPQYAALIPRIFEQEETETTEK
jgi:type IV secretory pathway TrbF-like protein